MMKFKKIAGLTLATLMVVSTTACRGVGLGPEVVNKGDETKTIIKVGNYYGGLGDEWLTVVEQKFEAAYANRSFEEGKMGVDIVIDNSNGYRGQNVIDAVDKNDVWFGYMMNYYDLVSQNIAMDISDVVTGDLGEVCEAEKGVTIESKLMDNVKGTFKAVGGGKYYGLPVYEGFYGLVYDIDLFESEGFYFIEGFDRNGNLDDMFVTSSADVKSEGPDGKAGTYDDGLPETYKDFYNLCRYMKKYGVTPMTYPGAFMHYWLRYLFQVWADYEGAEQMSLNYNLSGIATDLVSLDENGNLVDKADVEVKPENSYELQSQAGKYYALQFAKTLASNSNWFSTAASATGQTQEMAQKEFLYSSRNSNAPTIGMVLDGCWFNAEVDEAYTDMVNAGDATASKQNRKIGFMPIPKATADKVGEKLTFVDTSRSVCFINSKVSGAKAEVAKLFLKYFHTNESIASYTEKTDATRPYKYTVDESKLTHFGRTMMNIHNNANVIYTYSSNQTYLKNSQIFEMDTWSFTSTNGNSNPFHVFRDKNVSVADYFNGMYSTTKASIDSLLN